MSPRRLQEEKPFARDPETHIIHGAEPFVFPADATAAPGSGAGQAGSHAVLFLHGWTSTPRELRFLARRVATAGFHCEGILLKGHGRTVRALCGVAFRHHLEEAEEAFARLAMAHDRVSVCGLSLGGLLALHLAARRRVANLVLIAPFLVPAGATFGIPNRWLVGRCPIPDLVGKDIGGPIDCPEGRAGHIAYHAMPGPELVSVVQATRDFEGVAPRITSPALIFHSVRDRTSDFAGSQALIRDLGSDDKTLVAFNRGNHVITLDHDRERLEAETVDWLSKRRG